MIASIGGYLMAFFAGVLSTLSPCVLPLLPIVISAAFAAHRYGVIAIALGMALAFSVMGVVLLSLGMGLGLDPEQVRFFAAVLMVIIAVFLLSPRLQEPFAIAVAGLGDFGQRWLSKVAINGLAGQFIIGVLLGVVWMPCVGPTLGAALVLASQAKQLASAAAVMFVFALGASFPVVILGLLSQQVRLRAKNKLRNVGVLGKRFLGFFLLVLSVLILSKQDKALETFLLTHSPDWLVQLTTAL